jgi:hypothetical protein
MIGTPPNPLEVNLNKMTREERMKWDDDNKRVEVTCITPKCGSTGTTTKEFANRITNITTGRVEYICGACLHRRAMKREKEKEIVAEMEKQAAAQQAQQAKAEQENAV